MFRVVEHIRVESNCGGSDFMSDGILVLMRRADAESLTQSLRAEGFAVEHEIDRQTGIERALSENFALVILDASPEPASGINGIESLRRIRHLSLAPVLMVDRKSVV